jgi:hypothetical protein
MAIPDLFSTRQKRERSEVPDVFVYDQLPETLRVQVVYILQDAIGGPTFEDYETPAAEVYRNVVPSLCRHFGRLRLAAGDLPHVQLAGFLLSEPNVNHCLDAIELSCLYNRERGVSA